MQGLWSQTRPQTQKQPVPGLLQQAQVEGEKTAVPLKLKCKVCGKTMLEVDMVNDNFSIPDLVYEKLQKEPNFSQPRCPHCKRKIKSEDIENFTLKISGEKGDMAFFSKHGSRIGNHARVMGFKVFTTKKKHRAKSNYLVVGHNESDEF